MNRRRHATAKGQGKRTMRRGERRVPCEGVAATNNGVGTPWVEVEYVMLDPVSRWGASSC